MPSGLAVFRDWLTLLEGGEVVIDWGDGRVQDVTTGKFLPEDEYRPGSSVMDSDLELLRRCGWVEAYDTRMVYLRPLPDPPRPTID